MLIYVRVADLGFLGFVVVAVAVVWMYGRRRWRMAAARAEEVRRLTWLAAAEAERAEWEAAQLAYVAPPIVTSPLVEDDVRFRVRDQERMNLNTNRMNMMQCAVCYKHTTTRCSQCKTVRYCSGKCQIFHWRQGHKDECRPQKIDDHNNDGENILNMEGLETNRSDLSKNIVDVEPKAQSKPLETSSAKSAESISQSTFVDSSPHPSSSSLSSLSSLSEDDFAGDDYHVTHSEQIKKASDHVILPEDPTLNLKSNPVAGEGSPVNNLSHSDSNVQKVHISEACTNNLELKVHKTNIIDQKAHNSKAVDTESSTSGTTVHSNSIPQENADETMGDPPKKIAESSCGVSSKQFSEVRFGNEDYSYKKASSESTTKSNNLCYTTNDRSTDIWLLKSKSARPPSTVSSVDQNSSNGGKHSDSRHTSFKIDNASVKINNAPSNISNLDEAIGTAPNVISEFKTSVRRAVQQLKSSHISKPSSGIRTEVSQKYKMIFPYDLFVKLYNCDKVEMHPSGLINCGNSCYANAVLQCLAFTRPLTSYFLQGLHSNICPKGDWCFTCEFESLLKNAKQGHSPLSLSKMLSHIHKIGSNLDHGREEDAHEFLRYAIDTMQSVCLKEAGVKELGTRVEETSLIQLIFGGYLHSKIKCSRCRGKSERHEKMMDLTVEINGDIGTLEEALARFTATEILDGENRYKCGRCRSYERAKKKLTVLEAPNVLTIALKRYQSGKFGKLNKAVRFPEILNLAPYMHTTDDKCPVYSLYAVVVHQDIMNATFSGHYVSYVKSAQGKWYKTDDSKIKPVDLGSVLSKNAYMLFYARCSPRAPSLIRNAIHKDSLLSRSFRFNDRLLPYARADSSSDNSSLLSYSDEGSCSTESSTRDSTTSTEELSDYIFGDSGRFYGNNSPIFSENSNSNSNLNGEGNVLNYGERLGWERSRGNSQFLRSDGNSSSSYVESRKLTVDCIGRGSDRFSEDKSSVLIRRTLPSKEGRVQTFY